MTLLAYVNGDILPQQEAKISVFDSGLNFADGVFEGLLVDRGRIVQLRQHMTRLFDSAKAFAIDMPMSVAEFENEIRRWLTANDPQIVGDQFHFRPIVTRGDRNPPRLDPKFSTSKANIIFVGGPVTGTRPSGLSLMVSSFRRPSPDVFDPKIKSIGYGNNLLARIEATRHGYDDCIMLDQRGFVAETSVANIFIVKNGSVCTPHPTACLNGITRQAIIRLTTDQHLDMVEKDLSVTDLKCADEVFITGTAAGVASVTHIDRQPVRDGNEGSVTSALRAAYTAWAYDSAAPI